MSAITNSFPNLLSLRKPAESPQQDSTEVVEPVMPPPRIYPQFSTLQSVIASPIPLHLSPSAPIYTPLQQEPAPTYTSSLQSAAPSPNPWKFRAPNSLYATYEVPVAERASLFPEETVRQLFPIFRDNISDFNPILSDRSDRLHLELELIGNEFLNGRVNLPFKDRVSHCEHAIGEIIGGVEAQFRETSHSNALLYFPRLELLEIGLRNHFFDILLLQQMLFNLNYYELHSKFPEDLNKQTNLLLNFITKNGFYETPFLHLCNELVHPDTIESIIKSGIENTPDHLSLNESIETYKRLISEKLQALQLENPSWTSEIVESRLKEGLTEKLISKQSEIFRTQFLQTGTVTCDEMREATDKIHDFAGGDRNTIVFEMFRDTFGLSYPDQAPFEKVRSKVVSEREEQLSALEKETPSKFASFLAKAKFTSFPTKEERGSAIKDIACKQFSTLEWAEREFNETFAQPLSYDSLFPTPSAPPMDGDVLSSALEDVTLQLPVAAPIVSQTPQTNSTEPTHSLQDPVVSILEAMPARHKAIASYGEISYPTLEDIALQQQAATPLGVSQTPQTNPTEPMPPLQDRVVSIVEPTPARRKGGGYPIVSYVDLVFGHLFNGQNNGWNAWNSLPEVVQRDVLRHCYHFGYCQGKAEDLARELFNQNIADLQREFNRLNQTHVHNDATTWNAVGERLIDLFYSKEWIQNPVGVIERFKRLPAIETFLWCVVNMADAAGVDREYALRNWNQSEMIPLSVLALEKCLHTIHGK